MIILIALVINLVISLIVANSAKSRDISTSKVFLISFFLTPILGMFVTLLAKEAVDQEEEEEEKFEVKEDKLMNSIRGTYERIFA